MVCGLFSSFDPNVYSGSLTKWLMMPLVLFLGWSLFIAPWGVSFWEKVVFSFTWNSVEGMKNPKQSFLVMSSIFVFFFVVNLGGLVPFFFSLSSHLSFNLSVSLPLWMGGFIFSWFYFFKKSMAHLVPLGSPEFLWPLLVLVESVSLLIRPFTLAIRLMANVMAGHLILSLMGGFFSWITSIILPISISVIIMFISFEMVVSVVQSYVFMNLMMLYWDESDHS